MHDGLRARSVAERPDDEARPAWSDIASLSGDCLLTWNDSGRRNDGLRHDGHRNAPAYNRNTPATIKREGEETFSWRWGFSVFKKTTIAPKNASAGLERQKNGAKCARAPGNLSYLCI